MGREQDPMLRFFSSATGAGIAEMATLPIDITKLRMQTQVGTPLSQFIVARHIVANEGVVSLWKGWRPALLRQCSYTGLSLVLYEPIRDAIAGDMPMSELPFWTRVLAGGTAGSLSIFVMNPTDVLKARLQNSRGDLKLGATVREIVARSGIRGLWAGWSPNVARSFVGNACELGCYDHFKQMLVASPYEALTATSGFTHLGASTAAGFVSAVFSTPVDVLKTRIQTSAGLENKSFLSLCVSIPREEGFGAFYKGFWPLFQRKVTWTVIFFVAYERIRIQFLAIQDTLQ